MSRPGSSRERVRKEAPTSMCRESRLPVCGSRTRRRVVNVLAERNLPVAPVAAWVESGDEGHVHPEAELKSRILQQTLRSSSHLPTQVSSFHSCNHRKGISLSPGLEEAGSVSSSENTHQVSSVRMRVRHQLAAQQTVQDLDEDSQLPGGRWKTSAARGKAESHTLRGSSTEDGGEETEEDDGILLGQHDQPLHLHHERRKTVTFQSDVNSEPKSSAPGSGFITEYRASHVLLPRGTDTEQKKQRQSQFLTDRLRFMDIEREQVKEHQRHKKHMKRTARIKNEKEQFRRKEEKRIEEQRQNEEERQEMAEREFLILERLRLDEEEAAAEKQQRHEMTNRSKENKRYMDAIQALMKAKLEMEKVDLPPLCSCGDSFWDSNPESCANNCLFYNNPKVYAQVVQSVLLSCDLKDGGLGHRK
ncbi:hypothetical protein DNTS_022017 [Danionella cerebrum]|uniref:Coiled-coil domain-containing protein 15 n=1 Tax=Danionella cerebrum TaxID=2873325 RepID=A0A553QQ40_9TELE|nr:hypothetical protein DNTS_022017 [Danionella translucida]TRY92095.1 hypothetical protein DNTS_022017 [Danionella translucida]